MYVRSVRCQRSSSTVATTGTNEFNSSKLLYGERGNYFINIVFTTYSNVKLNKHHRKYIHTLVK